jgi:hypothetical protein
LVKCGRAGCVYLTVASIRHGLGSKEFCESHAPLIQFPVKKKNTKAPKKKARR